MFRKNDTHNVQSLFSPERELPEKLKNRLDKNWSTIFYREIFVNIKEENFSGLYFNNNGRPNVPINILAGLEILKELFQHTDEVAYERFLYDLTFQRALGVEFIEDAYFSIRSLYHFRGRLAEYELQGNPNPMEDVFKSGRDKIISDLGLKTGLQRVDSVMIGANIKRMNRLMLFHKVLSNLVILLLRYEKAVEKEVQDMIKEDEDSIAYRLPTEEVQSTTRRIAEKIYTLLNQYKNDDEIISTDAYKNAVRLLDEQCNIDHNNKNPQIRLKPPVEISSGSLQNPADPDATYRKKNGKEFWGYSAHASETCDKDNPCQVITSVDLVKNNVDDAVVLKNHIAELKEETNLETMISDGAFHSPDNSVELEINNVHLITTAIRGKKTQKPDILDSKDFTFEDSGLIHSCPQNHRPVKQTLDKEKNLKASFDRRKCAACPVNSRCIAYLSEKQSRVVIDANRRWLDKNRRAVLQEEFLEKCRMRPAVEGLMDKIKPKYLHGRTLFRGIGRVKNRLILRACAINFKRYADHSLELFKKFLDMLLFFPTAANS
jgi:hypothetical protein